MDNKVLFETCKTQDQLIKLQNKTMDFILGMEAKHLRDIYELVIEDVPHQYQDRILDRLNFYIGMVEVNND